MKKLLIIGGILLAVIIVAIGACTSSYAKIDTIETTITRCDHQSDKYKVFTEDGVFENTDSWMPFRWKTDSSDMQNELINLEGKRVIIEKFGWRFHPLSMYENIWKVTEVVEPES